MAALSTHSCCCCRCCTALDMLLVHACNPVLSHRIDLSPVLLKGATTAHTELFHPNSGASGVNGVLDAVRVGDYKAIWQTGGAPDCSGNRGEGYTDHRSRSSCVGAQRHHSTTIPHTISTHMTGKVQRHDPPLLFNLAKDVGETTALDVNQPE